MILYKSTRGEKKRYTFPETLLKGIAGDGGLLVPGIIPRFSPGQLKSLSGKSYQERASFLINLFETGFSADSIGKIVHRAYGTNFSSRDIAPLVHLTDNQYLLELWHGPTCAFKDMALQIMPLFFEAAVKEDNAARDAAGNKPLTYLLLVATSGDTGKAALDGYKNKENIAVIVLYPKGRVSRIQELQMSTQEGNNVSVYALDGDFDAVQKTVKEVFNDKKFSKKLFDTRQTILSSANSINWGRLMPQIIYYLSAYADMADRGILRWGDEVNVTVPSGNFGNLLAAFYAKTMGLPIHKLICASNTNNVLTDFLQTGTYDVTNRSLVQTPSPSMDILVASNIERLLYTITNDSEKVSGWMGDLNKKGKFTVDEPTKKILQNEFYADWVSNRDCLTNVRTVYNKTSYLMDPHTSVAQAVAERYIKQKIDMRPMVICSTAHWAKFVKDVYTTVRGTGKKEKTDEFIMLTTIAKMLGSAGLIPKSISSLRGAVIRHKETCDAGAGNLERKIILSPILP
jgi:threonine synthase